MACAICLAYLHPLSGRTVGFISVRQLTAKERPFYTSRTADARETLVHR